MSCCCYRLSWETHWYSFTEKHRTHWTKSRVCCFIWNNLFARATASIWEKRVDAPGKQSSLWSCSLTHRTLWCVMEKYMFDTKVEHNSGTELHYILYMIYITRADIYHGEFLYLCKAMFLKMSDYFTAQIFSPWSNRISCGLLYGQRWPRFFKVRERVQLDMTMKWRL